MNCPNCGETNRADARFCKVCGAIIAAPEVAEAPAPVAEPRHVESWWSRGLEFAGSGRPRLVAGAVTAVVVAAIATVAFVVVRGDEPEATGALDFATVRRTDLVSVRSLDGEVASNEGPHILGRLSGTITQIADEGSKVERGKTLYSVDGQPVLLLYGALPAWRDIGAGSIGEDVRQLEENLAALGFSTGTVDETFTAATGSAVDAWLASIGLPQVGVVRLGRVVFASGALTVSEHITSVGAATAEGEEVMSTLSSEKVVKVMLANTNDLVSGDEVMIVLPGNKKVPGKVTSVSTPEASGAQTEEGTSTVAIVVPNDAGALAGLQDRADADVELVEDSRRNVLAVPVTALLARQNGGYAVEVDRGGRTELVAVTAGLYAADLVEVRGDLKEGDRVVVP